MTRRSAQSRACQVIAGDARRHPHLVTAACLLLPVVLSLVLWTAPAHAHIGLVASNPAAGQVVPLAVDHLTLEFDDELRTGSGVVVRGPDGAVVTRGQVGVHGTALDVGLDLTVTGWHTVAYRIVGPDGHPEVGSFSFRASSNAPVAEATAAAGLRGATSESSAPPRWLVPLLTLGTLVLLAYATAAARTRRRRAV